MHQLLSKKYRIDFGAILVITTLFFTIYNYTFDAKPFLGGDNGIYYSLGEAIASGQGYTNILHSPPKPATHYPPGYPALLSIPLLFSKSIVVMKWYTGTFLLLSLALLYLIGHTLSQSRGIALGTSVLVTVNYHILQYANSMMSEMPYLFFSLLAIYLVILQEKSSSTHWRYTVGIVLSITIGFYIRTLGIALVAGVLFYYLTSRQWKKLLHVSLGFFVLVIPWQIRNRIAGGGSYLNQLIQKNPYRPEEGVLSFTGWFTRFYENGVRYISKEIPNCFYPMLKMEHVKTVEWFHYALGIVILSLTIVGLIQLKRYRWLFIGYLGALACVLIAWPQSWFGIRFMLPVYPILVFLCLYAIYSTLNTIVTWKHKQKLIPIVLLGSMFLAGWQCKQSISERHEITKRQYTKNYQHYFSVAKWTNKNLSEDAVICCRKPGLFYIFSKRKACNFKNTNNTKDLIEDLKRKKIDYVVLDQLGYSSVGRYLLPAMKQFPHKFTLVNKTKKPETYLWKFHPEFGYFGEMKDGKRHGYGVLKIRTGDRYEGNWENGQRSGEGIFYWKNGQVWQGTWKNDKRHGYGILKQPSGQFIQGKWEEDKPVGQFNYHAQDGKKIKTVDMLEAEKLIRKNKK